MLFGVDGEGHGQAKLGMRVLTMRMWWASTCVVRGWRVEGEGGIRIVDGWKSLEPSRSHGEAAGVHLFCLHAAKDC